MHTLKTKKRNIVWINYLNCWKHKNKIEVYRKIKVKKSEMETLKEEIRELKELIKVGI
jgi:hypothetical protein